MTHEQHYSKHASLALMAVRLEAMKIWTMVCEGGRIKQKVRQYEAMDKLLACLINMWMGGHGLVEINTRLRTDIGLQRAFGQVHCAEQSTISDTLDACTAEDVEHLDQALTRILHMHGRVMQRRAQDWLVLDVDMMGLVAGAHCEGATKGFFNRKRDRRGRQLGRVLASETGELITQQLYEGRRQLERSLIELIDATEAILPLHDEMAENTVFRVDAGGGNDSNINAMLLRGYHVLTKVHSWQRAKKLASDITDWWVDPREPHRQVGWVLHPHAYVRATRQLAIRTTTKKNVYKYRVLVTTLSDLQLCTCFNLTLPSHTPWPLLYAYDLRGGGIETQNRCDQQGLGLGHRNKRRFVAQQMLILLAQLAHNVLIWMRAELAHTDMRFVGYGLKRLVRDVLSIDGLIHLDPNGHVSAVDLNPHHALATAVAATWPLPNR